MLQNIESVVNLKGLARAKARDYDTKTVNPALIADAMADGWQIAKKNRRSVRLKRNKSNQALLEDRVWTLLYRMGFPFLSVVGGGALFNPKDSESESSRVSVVGISAHGSPCSPRYCSRSGSSQALRLFVAPSDSFVYTNNAGDTAP